MRPLLLLCAAAAALACDARSSSSSLSPSDAAPSGTLAPASPANAAPSALSAAPSALSAAASTAPPAPSSPAAPAYDLTADLAARTAAARALFPAAKYPAFAARVEADVFLLVAPQGRAALDAGAFELRRALGFYYGGHAGPDDPTPPFTRRPVRAVTVILLQPRDAFLAFASSHYRHDASQELGFYQLEPRDIVLGAGEGLGTLDHELVHVATEVDAPELPAWMGECLGTVFEQPVLDPDGTMHGARNARIDLLAAAIRQNGASPPGIADLFGMTTHDFKGGTPLGADGGYDPGAKAAAQGLNYARARALCLWLDARPRQKMWAFYHAWRDGMASDRTGEKAFARVMGAEPKAMEEDWRRWVVGR